MTSRRAPAALPASFDDGTAAELLISLAAIADPDWREVFDGGEAERRRATAECGRVFVRDVALFGRFGFLNLLGPAYAGTAAHSMSSLVARVRRMPARELHVAMLGEDAGSCVSWSTRRRWMPPLTATGLRCGQCAARSPPVTRCSASRRG